MNSGMSLFEVHNVQGKPVAAKGLSNGNHGLSATRLDRLVGRYLLIFRRLDVHQRNDTIQRKVVGRLVDREACDVRKQHGMPVLTASKPRAASHNSATSDHLELGHTMPSEMLEIKWHAESLSIG